MASWCPSFYLLRGLYSANLSALYLLLPASLLNPISSSALVLHVLYLTPQVKKIKSSWRGNQVPKASGVCLVHE